MAYKMDVSKIILWYICELDGFCSLVLFPNAYYRNIFLCFSSEALCGLLSFRVADVCIGISHNIFF